MYAAEKWLGLCRRGRMNEGCLGKAYPVAFILTPVSTLVEVECVFLHPVHLLFPVKLALLLR
jgi:hypothetical protein